MPISSYFRILTRILRGKFSITFYLGYSLRELNLEDIKMGDTNVMQLCQTMNNNDSICFLNLSQNKITDEGAKALVEVLKLNIKLNVLFIRRNHIKAKGAATLARAIASNDCLHIFDASFNSFGSQVISKQIYSHRNSINQSPI